MHFDIQYDYHQGYLQGLESSHSSVSLKWHPAIAVTDMKSLTAGNCLVSEQNEKTAVGSLQSNIFFTMIALPEEF